MGMSFIDKKKVYVTNGIPSRFVLYDAVSMAGTIQSNLLRVIDYFFGFSLQFRTISFPYKLCITKKRM